MTRNTAPRRSGAGLWIGLAALALVVLVLAPNAIAAAAGRVLGEALVTALSALTAIFGSFANGG